MRLRPKKFIDKNQKRNYIEVFKGRRRFLLILLRLFRPSKFIRFYRFRVLKLWQYKKREERKGHLVYIEFVKKNSYRQRAHMPGKRNVYVGSGKQNSKLIRKLVNTK